MPTLDQRRSGVLAHLTSLPDPERQGVLGGAARRFVDLLTDCGFSVWQMLPVGPPGADGSPYFSRSVHAGDVSLVDLGELEREGWMQASALTRGARHDDERRSRCFLQALIGFENGASAAQRAQYGEFLAAHRHWLLDDGLFLAIKTEQSGRPWWEWPPALRDREPAALAAARQRHAAALEQFAFEQFLFDRQWRALRQHARQRGLRLFGDLPIYVAQDSVEVWAQRRNFRLDAGAAPLGVAGVPPDYFSADGQVWGNPLYDWEYMQADDFAWWVARIGTQLERFDFLRLDHFRGLESYWEIPRGAATGREGRWRAAAGEALLRRLQAAFGGLPLAAEDLGMITPAVHELRERFGLPGMLVLQFAFDGSSANPYLPHNHVRNSIVYTGTHDNDTTLGWYRALTDAARRQMHDYFACGPQDVPDVLTRAALASVAALAVVPMQDLLRLGSEARMNTPATVQGNWRWSFGWQDLPADFVAHWRQLNHLYGRAATPDH